MNYELPEKLKRKAKTALLDARRRRIFQLVPQQQSIPAIVQALGMQSTAKSREWETIRKREWENDAAQIC